VADDPRGDAPYRKPRIAAGLGLLVLVGVLEVADILSPNFAVDSIQLGLLLGTSLLFLGVEGAKWLLR